MITGDKRFRAGNERYELQKSAVGELTVMYWGPGALIPRIPFKRFDVITAQDPFLRGHLAWHLSWFLAPRLNIQVHTDLSAYGWWKRVFAGHQLRIATTVRVVSEKIKQQVLALAPRAEVHVLPIFIDISKFTSVVHQSHTQKNILWIGRFEEEKNPMAAIEIARTVPDATFTMLGAGSMEGALRQAAPYNVKFETWQNPASFLARADVVLCTSWHESFGASIIESLAAGVPVVAPDVGVVKEAGAIVVPRNELGTAVVTVLKEGTRGHLALHMPTASEWMNTWRETL